MQRSKQEVTKVVSLVKMVATSQGVSIHLKWAYSNSRINTVTQDLLRSTSI